MSTRTRPRLDATRPRPRPKILASIYVGLEALTSLVMRKTDYRDYFGFTVYYVILEAADSIVGLVLRDAVRSYEPTFLITFLSLLVVPTSTC